MAVLSSRAHEPQSSRGFSTLARLYHLARPTKTAMLRRLALLQCLCFNTTRIYNVDHENNDSDYIDEKDSDGKG